MFPQNTVKNRRRKKFICLVDIVYRMRTIHFSNLFQSTFFFHREKDLSTARMCERLEVTKWSLQIRDNQYLSPNNTENRCSSATTNLFFIETWAAHTLALSVSTAHCIEVRRKTHVLQLLVNSQQTVNTDLCCKASFA